MIALLIILAVLLAISLLKIGADAAYDAEGFRMSVVAGPFQFKIFPGDSKRKGSKQKSAGKTEKSKKTANKESKKKKSLDFKFLLEIVKLALKTLNRFRLSLHVDIFQLRYVSASDDPYKTAMNCAYATSAVNMLAPLTSRAFRVGDCKVEILTDFFEEKASVSGRLKLTIRVWRILYLALTLAFAFVGVWFRFKKRSKAKAVPSGTKAENTAAEDALHDKKV